MQLHRDQHLPRALALAGIGVGVVTLLGRRSAQQRRGSQRLEALKSGGPVRHSVTILKSPEELHRFWRDLGQFSSSTEITADSPPQCVAWREHRAGETLHRGKVEFEPLPSGRGTRATVEVQFPTGPNVRLPLRSAVGAQQIKEELRRFKQLMEAGEVASTEGQPSGRRGPVSRLLS